jgi:hypothetical protein
LFVYLYSSLLSFVRSSFLARLRTRGRGKGTCLKRRLVTDSEGSDSDRYCGYVSSLCWRSTYFKAPSTVHANMCLSLTQKTGFRRPHV